MQVSKELREPSHGRETSQRSKEESEKDKIDVSVSLNDMKHSSVMMMSMNLPLRFVKFFFSYFSAD